MAVNTGDRKPSKMEVLSHAIKTHEAITDLCLRDFGVRSRNSILRPKYENAAHLEGNTDRIDNIIFEKVSRIDGLANGMIDDLNSAKAIYPRFASEYDVRLSYQNSALAKCQAIKTELESIARMFDVDISCFRNPIKCLDREMHLIREWRKSDRRSFKGHLL